MNDLRNTDIVSRARFATSRHIRYRLGSGGRDPEDDGPEDEHMECDCSGFVAWCLRIPRKVKHAAYVRFNGGWLSTDAMVHDALAAGGILDQVPVSADALAGDVVVYGNGPDVGHCGILANVGASHHPGRFFEGDERWTVIDCGTRGVRERSFWSFASRARSTIHILRYTGWKP